MLKISTTVTVDYREHSDCILKIAVAGEMLDLYRSLKLRDFRIVFHRNVNLQLDGITRFLLEITST